MNATDEQGNDVLYYLCWGGNARLEDVKYLFENGLKSAEKGLHGICMSALPDRNLMEFLISKGANQGVGHLKETCVHMLCKNENTELDTMRFAVKKGADFNEWRNSFP